MKIVTYCGRFALGLLLALVLVQGYRTLSEWQLLAADMRRALNDAIGTAAGDNP